MTKVDSKKIVSDASVSEEKRRGQIVRTLGEGAFGEVKLVVDPRNPSCFVALKCIDLKKFQNNDDAMAQFKKEAYLQRLLSSKSCDNMIRYIGMRLETENGLRELQIYLEYADGGELFDQIEPDVGMPPVKAQFYFRQLLAGLEHIHGMGVVHRDIKPENLLLTGNEVLKISDFGMATMFRHDGRERMLNASCGTLPYASPEVIKGHYKAEPADIWSSGIVLVAMLAGELPWDSARQKCPSFNDWMTSTNMDKNPWKKINNNALSLLRAVLNDNENTRATLQRIKDHPWTMADFNYTKENLPARKKKRLSAQKMEMPTVSQPLTPHSVLMESSCCNDITSFSQPENLDAMLINPSQIGVSQVNLLHPLTLLVRRMTRFCVTVSMTELIPRIYSACAEMGFVAVDKPPNMLLLTYREMSFVITIYEMYSQGLRKVLVDCRRSRGDGIEFKRTFIVLKSKLTDIICTEGDQWMESRGLTCSQNAMVESWTRRN